MGAAAQGLFEAIQVQAAADTGTHGVFADVLAVAHNLVAGRGTARWRAQGRQQPAPQLLVGPAFQPQALQPVTGQGFAGQAQGGDAAFLDLHALAD